MTRQINHLNPKQMPQLNKKILDRKAQAQPIYYKEMAVSDIGVDEGNRIISGYAAIFGNKDDACDIIIKGAFAKSISERGPQSVTNRKIVGLYMHDQTEPIGKPSVLREDNKGLYFEMPLDSVPRGDQSLIQLKSGTLNQFSIGYQYVWDKMEYDEATDSFICKELNLFEISVVTFGCNEETEFLGMKSAEEIENISQVLSIKTEEIINALPYEQGVSVRQLLKKHIALAYIKPTKSLKEEIKPQGINLNSLTDLLKKL